MRAFSRFPMAPVRMGLLPYKVPTGIIGNNVLFNMEDEKWEPSFVQHAARRAKRPFSGRCGKLQMTMEACAR